MTGCLLLGSTAHASSYPGQRGEAMPPGAVATSLVTLCGLAVMLVVQPRGEPAALYAGDAMLGKLAELGFDPQFAGDYELADLYQPVHTSCQLIRTEHERLLNAHPQLRRLQE